MREGRNLRILYSSGQSLPLAAATNPAAALGGGEPFYTGRPTTGIPTADLRVQEVYCDTQWDVTPTSLYGGTLSAAFAGTIIFAAAGDWLMPVEQNDATPGSFSASSDARGAMAKILTLQGGLGEVTNELADVDITLDRPLPALGEGGDQVRVARAGNIFANVSASESIAGLVDYKMVFLWKRLATTVDDRDDLEIWIEPVQSNGCKLEFWRPGRFNISVVGGTSWDSIIADRFTSPFDNFGQVLHHGSSSGNQNFDDDAARVAEISSRVMAQLNGTVRPTQIEKFAPLWIKRTVPAGTNPGESAFALHVASTTENGGAVTLSDLNRLHAGTPIVWNTDAPTVRLIDIEVDRLVFSPGSVRVTATATDQATGLTLPNRPLSLEASIGTLTVTGTFVTDDQGRVFARLDVPAAQSGAITITARLRHADGGP